MSELLSVGLDVGTTTTQMVVSRLRVQNQASSFAVPRMEITDREILYQSPIHFTPLLQEELIDGEGIRRIVEAEYRKAGITPSQVDTGAVIITGQTSRKENAESVLHALSQYAGNFVVATAGPDLESVLAAKGAGAVEYSLKCPVLHMDIGGGTTNLALCDGGRILATGCLNIGARGQCPQPMRARCIPSRHFPNPLGIDPSKPPLPKGGWPEGPGGFPSHLQIAQYLATILEMAAGLREKTADYYHFLTPGTTDIPTLPGMTISFSGGVADCIEHDISPDAYGDLGPLLGKAIRQSRLCQGPYRLGTHTIRATVIGAGCHSAQLSGSTIFRQNIPLPLQNLPVTVLTAQEQEDPNLLSLISQKSATQDTPGIVFLPGWRSPGYARITALADQLSRLPPPIRIALEADMAKALGNALSLRLPPDTPILCIDGLSMGEDSYLDIGAPIGPALTTITKTLIFDK